MDNEINEEKPWRERMCEKAQNSRLRNVELYGYSFQINEDEIVISQEMTTTIKNYKGTEEERNFLENQYYSNTFGKSESKVLPYLVEEIANYTKNDRQNSTSRFFHILDDLKAIELLNKFFLKINKSGLIPRELIDIFNNITDDLLEIRQILIESLKPDPSQVKGQPEADQTGEPGQVTGRPEAKQEQETTIHNVTITENAHTLIKKARKDTEHSPEYWKEQFIKEFGEMPYVQIRRIKDNFHKYNPSEIFNINGMGFYNTRKGRTPAIK
ncbi:hypothetical protein KJ688_07690 [bacterium]|nr:hypothetical protein [bacterium]